MPQFDFSVYISQVFWMCISFGLLFWAIQKRIMPKFEHIKRQRHEKKSAALDQANAILEQANAVVQETESRLIQARCDADAVMEDAIKISQDRMQQALNARHQSYHLQMEALKSTLDSENAHAWKTLYNGVPELSAAAIAKWSGVANKKEDLGS